MKHLSLVTRKPETAQTALEEKVDFKVDLVDRGVSYVLQKESVL